MKDAWTSPSPEEVALFKKKLARLARFQGTGTELISVYIPPGTNRGTVMDQLSEEVSQSSNIKDPKTRKNVQSALRKIINFLKRIDYAIPETGLAVFAGNVSTVPGKNDIRLFTLRPIQPLETRLYWCDDRFNLGPLKGMVVDEEVYGLLVMDKGEATVATLKGKKASVVARLRSRVPGKIRAGGQSAQRFLRLREEAEHNFYKKIAQTVNDAFVPHADKLKGFIVAGPGMAKNYFLEENLLDHRLRKKILGTVDVAYTDEGGVRETLYRARDLLKNAAVTRERALMNRFLEAVARTGLAAYGEKETLSALDAGQVGTLLVSEALEKTVYRVSCTDPARQAVVVCGPSEDPRQKASWCRGRVEVEEEEDFIDHLMERAKKTGAVVRLVSTETEEGAQFFKGFGGLGALLRYR